MPRRSAAAAAPAARQPPRLTAPNLHARTPTTAPQLLKRMKVPYGDDEETFCSFKKFQDRKVNTTGQMTLPEFRALVHHYMTRPTAPKLSHEALIAPKSAKELHALFNKKIVTKYATVQRAWREMDVDKDNRLTHAELLRAYYNMNIPLEGDAFKREVLKEFDPENKGFVTYQDFSKVIGNLIHPNARDTSRAMLTMEEESGAQPGLYFVPTARLGGNALDKQKAAKEAQREAVRLGDAAPPPMPPMDSMPEKISGFRSPRASPKAGGSVELVGFAEAAGAAAAAAPSASAFADGGRLAAAPAPAAPAAPAARGAAAPAAATVLAPVSVELIEDKMRKLLGRGWVHAAADIKRAAGGERGRSIGVEALRDVLAEKGVPLTAREASALQARYSSGAGSVDVDGLLSNAFKASFAGAAPPARKAAPAAMAGGAGATARLAAAAQAASARAQPSAFVKPGGGGKVGIF